MIAQILNRQFVLDQLESVQWALSQPQEDRRGDLPEVPKETWDAAHQALQSAATREGAASSGQQGYDDDPDARRGQEPALIDDTVFLSHDPIMSNFQSALEKYFREGAPGEIEEEAPEDDERRSEGIPSITGSKIANCDVQPRSDDGRRIFNRYSETDPRWVASLFAMGVKLFQEPHLFNPFPAPPMKISNQARLVLVGDWGTGLPRAVAVSERMREVVTEGVAAGLEQHVIHLGDVYYSGWEHEYKNNFLSHWPAGSQAAGTGKVWSWCLNGNHDMYSGGHAYFDYLLADQRFAQQKRSSFFSLHNDYWDILGLDTAYEDAGLQPPQAQWMKKILGESTRRSMLLSHHQLFSVYEGPSEVLQEKVNPLLEKRPADAWFWGHEHRCVFYDKHENVRNARLIGHGGVPVYMTHGKNAPYPPPSFYEYREYFRGLTFFEKWAYFGFAVVDLDNGQATVRYIDEFGTTHYTEVL